MKNKTIITSVHLYKCENKQCDRWTHIKVVYSSGADRWYIYRTDGTCNAPKTVTNFLFREDVIPHNMHFEKTETSAFWFLKYCYNVISYWKVNKEV